MNPFIAALIPTLLLGGIIIFLILRIKNQAKSLAKQSEEQAQPAEKIIRREETQDTATPTQETAKASYFDASNALLATLSHELKTPLNGIMGITQMLREENEDSTQLIEMEGCAQHMHSVLHTLTNLARIQNENEYLPNFREWVSLRDTIEQIREDVAFRADGRQIKIKTSHGNIRLRLRGDSDHIQTIIKSTLLGSIEAAPITEVPQKIQTLQLSWEINADEIELSIINPLEILEDEREKRIEEIINLAHGTERSRVKIEYLHMAVARALLGFYQGSTKTEITPEGVRTTIRFTMEHMVASPSANQPIGGLRVQSGQTGMKALRELPKKMKILVAEDDRASRNLLILLLAKMGQEATHVENGEDAVLALQNDPTYDVVLMDVDMPKMDGTEATQAIRSGLAGDEVKNIPIVAVTAFNVLSDRGRFKEAGMYYYLPKPVDIKELRAALVDIIKEAEKTAND